jgi:hypothetical protein
MRSHSLPSLTSRLARFEVTGPTSQAAVVAGDSGKSNVFVQRRFISTQRGRSHATPR